MYLNKIYQASTINNFIKNIKSKNKKIVFTNGCFDILHVGHVRYLFEAKKLGDFLIVAINSDESVKKLKGNSRPIVPENDRLEIIAALEFVDCVIMFKEETPYNIISLIKPDVLVKGGDYKKEDIVGNDIVPKVVTIPLVEGKSTTNILQRNNF